MASILYSEYLAVNVRMSRGTSQPHLLEVGLWVLAAAPLQVRLLRGSTVGQQRQPDGFHCQPECVNSIAIPPGSTRSSKLNGRLPTRRPSTYHVMTQRQPDGLHWVPRLPRALPVETVAEDPGRF